MNNELLIQSMKRRYKNISKSKDIDLPQERKTGGKNQFGILSQFWLNVFVLWPKNVTRREVQVPDITMNKK